MFRHRNVQAGLLLAAIGVVGCEALHNAGVPGMEPYLKKDPVAVAEEKSMREKFNLDRDHKAFYWLLRHRVSNGMTMGEVEDALGEPGESTSEFANLKSDGLFQMTDSAYRWGPDKSGNSAIIFFRDGHVINFDPHDYQSAGPKISKPSIGTVDTWGS